MSIKVKNNNVILYLTIIYIFIEVSTPHYRFPILDSIHLTRILALVLLLNILVSNKQKNIKLGTSIIALYVIMLTSYFLSDYKNFIITKDWFSEYWKVLLIFWFICFAAETPRELRLLVVGIIIAFGFYQIISWRDFLAGGSYVYQQGMKRMIGTWSGGGIGAANSWGLDSLFFFPLGYYVFKTVKDIKYKILAFLFLFLSFLSIFFSGTRAALYTLFIMAALHYYKYIFRIKILLGFAIIALAIHLYLPQDLKQRYLGSIYSETHSIDEQALSIAESSAESRLQGLIDGFILFKQKPLLGFGPGTSAYARIFVNDKFYRVWATKHVFLQLHNFYGQILSEIGLIGTIQFVIICLIFWNCLGKTRIPEDDQMNIPLLITAIRYTFIIYIIYGYGSHTLYNFNWLFIFALGCLLYKIYPPTSKKIM